MTLNATTDISNQDCSSIGQASSDTASNSTSRNDQTDQPNELTQQKEAMDCSTQSAADERLSNEEQISIQETINNVLEQTEEKVNNRSPNNRKKDKDQLDSPKKRTKLTSKKDEQSPKADQTATKSPPLIRQPKLQINDKTLKKLRSDTDDLVFDNDVETAANSDLNHHSKFINSESKPTNRNINLMPVVNNVLSRSIAAIFKNSTVNKNGSFNSYSALGFNKGPRVKRVCRQFSDVYRGLPRAVFPAVVVKDERTSNSKTGKVNSSAQSKRKTKKLKNNNKSSQSSPSTSKSNSNSSFKEDDSTECSLDSDDLEITTYIERNLKKEMDSSKDVSV